MRPLLTVAEVAEILRMHPRSVIDLIAVGPGNGGLLAINVGSAKLGGARWRIRPADLEQFMGARQNAA